jgi:hypothetical protein
MRAGLAEIRVEAIDWSANVSRILEKCELAGGVPMFRTKYLAERLKDPDHPGKYLCLFICEGRKWSQLLNNVPLEEIEKLERG